MVWGDEPRIVVSAVIETGQAICLNDTWYVSQLDWWRQQCKGSFPLWTRHSLGVIEAERDRRRHG